MSCSDFDKVQRIYVSAKETLGEVLSAVEFLDYEALALTKKHFGYPNPVKPAPLYVLVETSGSCDHHDKEVRAVGAGRWLPLQT